MYVCLLLFHAFFKYVVSGTENDVGYFSSRKSTIPE